VTGVPLTEEPSPSALAALPEPVDLRGRWWAAETAGVPHPDLGTEIGDDAWRRWGPQLESAGVDRAWLGSVVDGYGRELWLWMAGERTWAHVAEGLAGRVLRRLPS